MKNTPPVIAFLLVLFLAVSSMPAIVTETARESVQPSGRPHVNVTTAAYTPHAPINITCDDDFVTQGWPTGGGPKNPYIIEGLNITSTGVCISVSDTRRVFIIRDCLLSSSTPSSSAAVRFENLTIGSVIGCVIDDHPYGVYITNSTYCWMSDNTVSVPLESAGAHGIHIDSSYRCTLDNNTVDMTEAGPIYQKQVGFFLEFTQDCWLANNVQVGEINQQRTGFFLNCSEGFTLINNTATGNRFSGFKVYYSERFQFINNTATNCYESGFAFWFCHDCTLVNNNGIGFEMYYSENCTLDSNTCNGWRFLFLLCRRCTLTDNSAVGGGYGFWLDRADHFSLTDCTAISTGSHGFWILDSYDVALSDSTAANSNGDGFLLDSSTDCVLTNDSAAYCSYGTPPDTGGFHLNQCYNCTLADNTASMSFRCSFILVESGFCTLTNNTVSYSEHEGFLLRSSHSCMLTDNTVADPAADAFSLDDSDSCTLTGNTVTHAAADAFSLDDSDLCALTGNAVSDSDTGFHLNSADSCELTGNIVTDSDTGFYLNCSDSCTLTANAVSGSDTGFHLLLSDACSLSNNSAIANAFDGFLVDRSQRSTMTSNTATGNTEDGFKISDSYDCTITGNTASTNMRYGFYLIGSRLCTVTENTAISNTLDGFELEASYYCTLTGNTATGNTRAGFWLSYVRGCTLTCNTATGSNWGILIIYYSIGNVLFLNWIGLNTVNALDEENAEGRNTWDDSVSQGNHWSDYNGTGVYPVPGPAGSVDRFPFGMEPYIDHPADIRYYEGSMGHSITWYPISLQPSSYELYIDTGSGIQYGMGPWDGSEIVVSVDGRSLGVYNYTLLVYDTTGNYTRDSVIVTVDDNTAPTINTPPDLVYESGTTGHTIVWIPYDLHPATYDVEQNGTPIAGGWDGSSINISADGLELGLYNYTLLVYDTSGNSASDTVIITVVDNTSPTIDRPADLSYEYGTTGHTIAWTPVDHSPASYVILQDGDEVASGAWNGSDISVSVDGLATGSYNYTIVVYDTSGHSVSDQVMVTVSPPDTTTTTTTTTATTATTSTTTTATTTTTPTDGGLFPGQWVIVVAACGAAIVVLVVIIYLRRR